MPGMYTTAVGYVAGYTENPTYEEVSCARGALGKALTRPRPRSAPE